MKLKTLTKIISVAVIILVIGSLAIGVAHAAKASTPESTGGESVGLFGFMNLSSIIESTLATIVNTLLGVMGILVAISGWLLNYSINLTLNIKSFVESTSAIYTTWKAIRDISGIFLIFFLLYAAFQLITGLSKPNFGDLIKNIVMAGIMINFSFFFASLGIDASNIVSTQLYNAIAPANSLNASAAKSNLFTDSWTKNMDGGLSAIFMNSLKIQAIHKTKFTNSQQAGVAAATNVPSALILIILSGVVGLVIEFVAAMSFAAAALAFIFRFVILILLLAFSPIWFLSFLPEVGSYAKDWVSKYKSMLMFMPIYLLLMYLALNVLTTSPLFGNGPTVSVQASGAQTMVERALAATTNSGNTTGEWYQNLMTLGVNATIVVFLLNMPLVAAASIAGKSIGILDKAVKNFGANAVWGKVGSQAASYAKRNSYSRVADKLSESNTFKAAASRSVIASSLLKGTRSLGADFKEAKEGQYKDRQQFAESLGADMNKLNTERSVLRSFENQLASARARNAGASVIDTLKDQIGKSKGEIAKIENERKLNYANTIENSVLGKVPGSSTLLSYIANDRVAAAKLQIPIHENNLTRNKDDLKEIRADIKALTKAINASPTGATAEQTKDLDDLRKDEVKKVGQISVLEKTIDDLKLIS